MEEFQTTKPIYMQIVDKISQQIVRGSIKPGDKLPSVREMAVKSGVNPNTVQRTYSELERMEIVETRRGQGTFVTEAEGVILELKRKLQTDLIKDFVHNMQELGLSKEEMMTGIEHYMEGEETK